MKKQLRTVFSPILNLFESGDEPFNYKPSHRKILIFVSLLFSGLAAIVAVVGQNADPAYLFPALVFGLIGFVGFIVGLLGTDRAVSRIWGNR